MNELPDLPFEKVLSYLSLVDRLKSRAISKRWCMKIDSLRVKSLCYSNDPNQFFFSKNPMISGVFAQNFISSAQFSSFFNTFGKSIFLDLKHLRLGNLNLNKEDESAFVQTLQMFGQLEKLDIARCKTQSNLTFTLHLPMLSSIQLEEVRGIKKLTLDTPRLKRVLLESCNLLFSSDNCSRNYTIQDRYNWLRVHFVHSKTVEKLIIDNWEYTELEKLENLQYLYIKGSKQYEDPPQLAGLKQLKEGDSPGKTRFRLSDFRTKTRIQPCGPEDLLSGPFAERSKRSETL